MGVMVVESTAMDMLIRTTFQITSVGSTECWLFQAHAMVDFMLDSHLEKITI